MLFFWWARRCRHRSSQGSKIQRFSITDAEQKENFVNQRAERIRRISTDGIDCICFFCAKSLNASISLTLLFFPSMVRFVDSILSFVLHWLPRKRDVDFWIIQSALQSERKRKRPGRRHPETFCLFCNEYKYRRQLQFVHTHTAFVFRRTTCATENHVVVWRPKIFRNYNRSWIDLS